MPVIKPIPNVNGNNQRPSLAGRTVLITGASGGLGHALIDRFSAEAATIIGVYRQLPDEKTPSRDEHHRIAIDLADHQALQQGIEQLSQQGLYPDIVINNAAILGQVGASEHIAHTDWRRVMQVNFHAAVTLSTAWLEHMRKRGYGRIINLSGGGATSPRPFFNPYACSKTALNKFSENLAKELRNSGITVNSLAPGLMNTRMLNETHHTCLQLGLSDELDKMQTRLNPEQPFTAAEFCLMLCQPTMERLTGKILSAQWDDINAMEGYMQMNPQDDSYTMIRKLPTEP